MDTELIIGIHSIKAALENSLRNCIELFLTEDAKTELKEQLKNSNISTQVVSPHKLQEIAKSKFKEAEVEYQRVPSGALLIADALAERDMNDLYELVAEGSKKILCLDQISDVHNGAAILRTASFYGVDAVILPARKSFRFSPGYFRIASGAHEYLKLFQVQNLSKTIRKMQENGTIVVGLSEHADEKFSAKEYLSSGKSLALVLGKEETGISNAVMRVVDHKLALNSQGSIKSLNVSVASAVSLEKCFGN
tara:strand:- start:68613 stop:69365 length:753 start_codon:yes stop_codon:yes gene_type:complete